MTPAVIAQTRSVDARAILENRVDLRAYPFRLLIVTTERIGQDGVVTAVAAAEVLEQYGWELVTTGDVTDSRFVYAILRRRG